MTNTDKGLVDAMFDSILNKYETECICYGATDHVNVDKLQAAKKEVVAYVASYLHPTTQAERPVDEKLKTAIFNAIALSPPGQCSMLFSERNALTNDILSAIAPFLYPLIQTEMALMDIDYAYKIVQRVDEAFGEWKARHGKFMDGGMFFMEAAEAILPMLHPTDKDREFLEQISNVINWLHINMEYEPCVAHREKEVIEALRLIDAKLGRGD